MNSLFEPYIKKFRELNAISEQSAVTKEQLFAENQTISDSDIMHKMLSAGIVKRTGINKYWLDENVVANPKGVLKQRFGVIILGIILGIVWVIIEGKMGVEKLNYTPIEIPDKTMMSLQKANVIDAEFMYDINKWTIDTSTKPYTFYYNESMTSGKAANFNIQVGEEFNYTLDEKLLEELVKVHTEKNPFIDVTMSELKLLDGKPVAYYENTLTYTEQAIEQGIESGAITEEIIDSIGGKDVLLNAPPTSQLAIFTVSDGHLCVCSGAYFTDEQKEAIIDAIAVAIESIDVIK